MGEDRPSATDEPAIDLPWRVAFHSNLIAIVVQDGAGRVIECNAAAERLFGISHEQMLGSSSFDEPAGTVHADGRPMAGPEQPPMRALASGAPVIGATVGVQLPDGRMRWLLVNSVLFHAAPHGRLVMSSFMDITGQVRLEAWQRLTLSLFEQITKRAPLHELLANMVLAIERQLLGTRCSLHLLSADGLRLAQGFGPSLPTVYLAALENLPIGPTAGSCGAAAATGKRVVVGDILTHPNWMPYLPLALPHGLRACWSEPVFDDGGKVLGTFAIYYDTPREPDSEDLELMCQAASLASLAVQHHRAREDLLLAAALFEQGSEAVAVTDAQHAIERVNPAFEQMTGFTLAEVRGSQPFLLHEAGKMFDGLAKINQRLEAEGRWQGEMALRRKDGALLPVWLSAFAVARLKAPVAHFVYAAVDLSETKAQAERIRQLAFYDVLTGLPNRALANDRLQQAFGTMRRRDWPMALLFVDLDRFKEINDTQGHAVGDAVLVAVAQRFRSVTRAGDTLARIGGDEFLLLADTAREADAAQLGERLLGSLSEPIIVRDLAHHLSASIGIALAPNDGEDPETLLKHADIAMYRAKAAGGGLRFYRPEMGAGFGERVALARDLARALCEGIGLSLHFQPQVRLGTREMAGAEALLRWTHPTLGAIPPGVFIPLAEERGMMVDVGDWVLREACAQLAAWRQAGTPLSGRLAINYAAQQFEAADAVARTLNTVSALGIDASHLELELTENGLMRKPHAALRTMRAFREAGMSLAVDDFGVGYSSLSYLKQLPVERLKIDMSFVRHMLDDRNDYAIVGSIIGMAAPLGLETVAEGVERAEQAEALHVLGCTYGQGYLFGRPVCAAEFANRWLTGAGIDRDQRLQ